MKHSTIYTKIYKVLSDGAWHKKDEFCRPYSADLRRLQEMRHPNGWIEYEDKIIYGVDGKPDITLYRLTKVWDKFWIYYNQHEDMLSDRNGQLELAMR